MILPCVLIAIGIFIPVMCLAAVIMSYNLMFLLAAFHAAPLACKKHVRTLSSLAAASHCATTY